MTIDRALIAQLKAEGITNAAIERVGDTWPLWMQMCRHAAIHAPESLATLRAKTQSEARRALQSALRDCVDAAQRAFPQTESSTPLAQPLDALQRQLLVESFEGAALALPTTLTNAPSVTAQLLLLETKSNYAHRGRRASLRLWTLPCAGANLAWVRSPANTLTLLEPTFATSLNVVTKTLRNLLPSSKDVNNTALVWDIALLDGDTALFELGGESAGAMLLLAALHLLREHARSELRQHLSRLHGSDFATLAITAALAHDGHGEFAPVTGLTEKIGAWLKAQEGKGQTAGRVYVADTQEKALYASRLFGCVSIHTLATAVANDLRGKLTDEQTQLLDALLNPHGSALPEWKALGAIANTVATDTQTWLLQRYAHWAQQTQGSLHRQFVPLDMHHGLTERPEYSKRKTTFENLNDLLTEWQEAHGFQLQGGPGSGKTTLLRRLEMDTAACALAAVAKGDAPDELCLYVPLREYPWHLAETTQKPSKEAVAHAKKIAKANKEASVQPGPTTPLAWLRAYAALHFPDVPDLHALLLPPTKGTQVHTKLRLLFDGFNEITAPNAEERQASVQRLAAALHSLGSARMAAPLFSTRTHHTVSLGNEHVSIHDVTLQPWTPEHMEAYLRARCDVTTTADAPAQPLPKKFADLLANIRAKEPLQRLFGVPMHLVAQCELLDSQDFDATAATRAELFSAWLWQRLRREFAKGTFDKPELKAAQLLNPKYRELLDPRRGRWAKVPLDFPEGCLLVDSLFRQAQTQWRTHTDADLLSARRGEVAVPLASVTTWITDAAQRDAWLTAVQELSLADVNLDARTFAFSHQLWGEFLAAKGFLPPLTHTDAVTKVLAELAEKPLPNTDVEEIARLEATGSPPWEPEGELRLPAGGAFDEIGLFAIEACASEELCKAWLLKLTDWNLALAGRAAVAVRARLEPTGDDQAWASPQTTLTQIRRALHRAYRGLDAEGHYLPAAQLVDVRRRIEYGDILGQLGGSPDYLLKHGVLNGKQIPYLILKPDLWKQIGTMAEKTTYLIGDKEGDSDELNAEGELEAIQLDGFKMAAFPVTAIEWSYFLKAGGYKDPRWCQGRAAQVWINRDRRAQPNRWQSGQVNTGLQPVVSINVYEAAAYALFVGTLEAGTDSAPQIRLPVEGQWEAAAAGAGKNRWPHGNDAPTAVQIIHRATRLPRTSAVGTFPLGDTKDTKLSDMAGNVWEWTSSLKTAKLEKRCLENAADPNDIESARAARGGGAGNYAGECRAAYRNLKVSVSSYSVYIIGCRLVWYPPHLLSSEPLNGN